MTATNPSPEERRVRRGWMPLRLTSIVDETSDTKTFFFEDAELGGRAFDYIAGQYLTFRFDGVTEKPLVRSYTMSSAPCDGDFIGVTVKRVPGGLISNWMCDTLKSGDVLRARGPIGRFVFDPVIDQQHLVFVAAGSGVTPFLSIMKEHAATAAPKGLPTKMTLLVSFRTVADTICAKELQELAKHPLLEVQITYTRESGAFDGLRGRIDSAMIHRVCQGDLSGKTFFVCGPNELMTSTESYLLSNGISKEDIRLESFDS